MIAIRPPEYGKCDLDAAVITTQAHLGVPPTRARACRAAMRRARARGGPARARSASLVFVAATLACLASSDAFSLGIDVGADSTTVAASRSSSTRDVSVVPDDRGGRSSPSLVGFTERHAARVLGADAETLRSTCPRCVFGDPRSLVGADVLSDDGRGRVPFPSALKRARAETGPEGIGIDSDDSDSFRPETLAAMVVEDAARRASRAMTSEASLSLRGRASPSGGERVERVGRTPASRVTTRASRVMDASSYEHSSSYASNIATAALAVPGWWSQRRRRAFLDAATVAGIPRNKTTLVSETAAAAVILALRFQDEWNRDLANDVSNSNPKRGKRVSERRFVNVNPKRQKSVTVALFGVGARSAWASAVRFTADAADAAGVKKSATVKKSAAKKQGVSASRAQIRVRAEVLQQEWAEGHGGGWALDADVAAAAVRLGKRHTSENTSEEGTLVSNDDDDESRAEIARLASTDERSAARLMAAARRAKEVLSANAEATLEARGFFPDGSDLVAEIGREDVFANETPDGEEYVAAATAPLRRLLARRGGAIDAVELVGGGARVPAVQAAARAAVDRARENAKASKASKASRERKSVPIHTRLNLEEAVAIGAATVAANATKRAEAFAARAEAKALAKKKGKGNAQRARAADADAAAAARALRETPAVTDAFPRFVSLVVTEKISSPSASRGSVAVFRPGAGVPSRRDVVLARVRSGFEVALVESETEENLTDENLTETDTKHFEPRVFARFKVEGVEANVASAFASLGSAREGDPDSKKRIARIAAYGISVTLRFAVDRGGVVTLEKATSAVEVREGSAEVVEGALRVTETELEPEPDPYTGRFGKSRLAELEAERRALRWLRSRDEARAAADAAASALEGDALRTRDRLERAVERATRASSPGDEAREDVAATRFALEKALDAADDALAATFFPDSDSNDSNDSSAFDAKRRVSATRRLRRELVDAADAFFERVREDEEDEEEKNPNVSSSSDALSSEADAAKLVLELEDRVAELERDLDACRRGAKGGNDGGTARNEL